MKTYLFTTILMIALSSKANAQATKQIPLEEASKESFEKVLSAFSNAFQQYQDNPQSYWNHANSLISPYKKYLTPGMQEIEDWSIKNTKKNNIQPTLSKKQTDLKTFVVLLLQKDRKQKLSNKQIEEYCKLFISLNN